MTAGQQALWTGQRLVPGAPLYNMVMVHHMEGVLETARLQRAFARLGTGSDALRMRVVEQPNGDAELEHSAGPPELELINAVSESGAPWSEEEGIRWAEARARRPLPAVPGGALLDGALVCLGPERWLLYLGQHHLIADAWSAAICLDRLGALYLAEAEGDPGPGPLPPFAAYAAYAEGLVGTSSFERARAHWAAFEPAAPGGTGFYGGRRPARASARTERVDCPLGRERSRKLIEIARRPGVAGLSIDLSVMQLFAACLAAVMKRVGAGHSSQSILLPIHHRSTKRFQGTIGPFMEVLPVTIDCGPGATFESIFQSVRAEFGALLRQAVPGVSGFAGTRGVDVVLNYITTRFGNFAGLPTRTTWVHPGHGDPSHGLRLQVHDFHGTGEFLLQFDMQCDVFGAAEREALPRHMLALLDGMLEGFDAEVAVVPLLSAAEIEVLARGKAVGELPEEPEPSVLAAFHARAEEAPDATSVRERLAAGSWRDVTYGELQSRVKSFALALRARGMGPGDLVALHLPRSVEFVVAALGTMESGAAYLPLDTASPSQRLAKIVAASAAGLMVVDPDSPLAKASSEGVRPSPAVCTVRELEAESAASASAPGSPRQSVAAEQRAYVIYTSGSTGEPKGVEISHGALASYVFWARRQYRPAEGAGASRAISAAFFSPTSVDLSITSLFVPLCSGGAVHLYREVIGEPQGLVVLDVFGDDPADLIKLTPAHLGLLLERGGLGVERLQNLVVGGENLPRSLALRAQDAFGERVAIHNEYGPTEATVGCLVHRFDSQRDAASSVPIGLPIPGVRAYVVDERGALLPAGLPGELWIGGRGLAEGYLGQKALTEQCFLPDPFAAQDGIPGARGAEGDANDAPPRVYATGDLVREDPATGLLVYLGRRDAQVKVQGVRIELGEVEAAIQQHPAIASAAARLYRSKAASGPRVRADAWDNVRHCARCGLASNHPDARMENAEVCGVCEEFDGYREVAEKYFGTPAEMRALLGEPRAGGGGDPDCMALLSGGKDSTYALYQLVELGYRPLVFSLDNGYIAEGAKANIRRVVDHLGLELVMAETPSMNAIFADSLRQFSNVCQGCFKTIYTLSTNLARERGITRIVTGLSRGQIFETRLAPIYRAGIQDPAEVDRYVLDARRSYHRIDDAVSKHLDVSAFRGEGVFEEVQYVDFYRYHDVPLAEVLDFIGTRAAWRRPEDTGRSTNCLINDVGIRVHKEERGFHNYALPYSWDVRLGHKTRDECLDELNDDIDEERVDDILREVVGAPGGAAGGGADDAAMRLAAYYVGSKGVASKGVGSDGEPSALDVRDFLRERLPESMVPTSLVLLEEMPLTESGKVDRARLPDPALAPVSEGPVPPSGETETLLLDVWKGVLGALEMGVEDHFLDVGGDSILSLQVVARARAAGIELSPRDVFDAPTVRELSLLARPVQIAAQGADEDGAVALTPIQRWFLDGEPENPGYFAMSVVLELGEAAPDDGLVPSAVRSALAEVQAHHGALRLRFDGGPAEWSAQVVPSPVARSSALIEMEPGETVEAAEERLGRALDLTRGPLFGAALWSGPGAKIVLAAHHLAVDAASWAPIIEDFRTAYGAARRGVPAALPEKSFPWRGWVNLARGQDTVPPPPGVSAGLERDAQTAVFRLEKGATDRLLARESGGARTQDRLLAALAVAASETLGMAASVVDVEAHGRDLDLSPAVDVSRTVGWFTTMTRVRLVGDDPAKALAGAANARHRVDVAQPQEPAAMLFNYLGKGGAPGSGVLRGIARLRDGDARRTHGLDVHAILDSAGTMGVHVTFVDRLYPAATVQAFGESILAALPRMTELEAPLSSQGEPAPPSAVSAAEPFSASGLSAADLDDLLADFGSD